MASIKMILNMDKDNFIGDLEIFIRAVSFLIKDKDMDKCIGKMEVITKACGVKEYNMDKDNYLFYLIESTQEYSKIMFL